MPDDPRVQLLIEEMLDSGGGLEEVCRDTPELEAQVREGLDENLVVVRVDRPVDGVRGAVDGLLDGGRHRGGEVRPVLVGPVGGDAQTAQLTEELIDDSPPAHVSGTLGYRRGRRRSSCGYEMDRHSPPAPPRASSGRSGRSGDQRRERPRSDPSARRPAEMRSPGPRRRAIGSAGVCDVR